MGAFWKYSQSLTQTSLVFRSKVSDQSVNGLCSYVWKPADSNVVGRAVAKLLGRAGAKWIHEFEQTEERAVTCSLDNKQVFLICWCWNYAPGRVRDGLVGFTMS